MTENANPVPLATPEALQAEIDALRAKNVELLAELKAAKAAKVEAIDALDAARTSQETAEAARDAAMGEARALRLDGPVAALLADVAVDAEMFHLLWDKHYRFDLDANGAVVILDAEGNPAMLTESAWTRTSGKRGRSDYREEHIPAKTRPAAFTAADIRALCDASPDSNKFNHVLRGTGSGGSGAPSSSSRTIYTPPKDDGDQPPRSPAFGLR